MTQSDIPINKRKGLNKQRKVKAPLVKQKAIAVDKELIKEYSYQTKSFDLMNYVISK